MSTRIFFLNSNVAQYGEEELNSIQKFLFGQGILNTLGSSWEDWIANGDLKVTQRGAGANMSVDVKAGWALANTTRNTITFKVFCQSIGTTNLAVANNSSGSNRVDAVILRVSRSATPNITTNNVVTLEVITGSGVSALSDGAITTAISNDDFIRLANITVTNGDTDITNAQIADTRVRASTANNTFKQAPEMLEFKALSADPSTTNLAEGYAWFNSTTHTLNFWNGTVIKQLGGDVAYLSGDDTTVNGVDQSQTTQNANRAIGEANATTKNNKLAQSFIAGKTSITGVKLNKQADTGTFTGTVTVELYADSTGSPTGSALATVTLTNSQWLALAVGEFTATFGTPYTATLGATYHIVVSTSTADNTNHPNLGTNSAGGYPSGSVKFWNTTDGWTAVATIDLYFKTLHTSVSKVAKTDANGLIDYSLIPYPNARLYSSVETLTVNDLVSGYFYQSDGGVLYDNKALTTGNTTTSGGTVTLNLTVANQPNRTVVAFLVCSCSGGTSGVTATFDAVSMNNRHNNLGIGSGRAIYSWTLHNNASGASRPLAVTFPNVGQQWSYMIHVVSFYNTQQSTTLDGTFQLTGNGSASGTIAVTPTNAGALYSSFFMGSGTSISNTTNNLNNGQSTNNGTDYSISGDSGIVVPTIAFNQVSTEGGGSILGGVSIGLVPFTAPVFSYVAKSSASNTTNPCNKNKYDAFVGFVKEVYSTGGNSQALIQHSGIVSGLSGLTPLATYYIGNTAGSMSTIAGTNSKKIGVALSTTELLIKHDN